MKKFLLFVLSLVCGVTLVSCAAGGDDNGGNARQTEVISLTDKEITLRVGGSYKFAPTGAAAYVYTSSDAAVARVTASGWLTGIADGTAFIGVSSSSCEASATCRVNVIKEENYIRLNAENFTVAAGGDVTLKAEVIRGGEVSDDQVKFSYDLTECYSAEESGANALTVSLYETGNYVFGVSCGSLKAKCTVKAVNLSAETLATPEITVEECKTVRWNAVENAGGYAYSVNGGEWVRTAETSFNAESVTKGLKAEEAAVFTVKATAGETDYDFIDSLPVSDVFSHKYEAVGTPEYTCAKAGAAEFRCAVCGNAYAEEGYLAEHSWKDGACEVCDTSRTKKVSYAYDAANKCYCVAGADGGYDSEDLYIRAEYNDGTNGKHPVKYIGYGAFRSNKTIKRVILPESMTEFVDADVRFNTNKILKDGKQVSSPLRGQCFDDCSNLEYVSMMGVTELRDLAKSYYAHWNFRDCYNLKQVIVGNGFSNTGATFMRWDNTPKTAVSQADIYVCGDKVTEICDPESYPTGFAAKNGNNMLLTGDIFTKSDETSCYKWHFAEDGETIVTDGKHDFNAKDKCKKCGATNGYGVKYEYFEDSSVYYVSDNRNLTAKEVKILDTYTDGIHGTHPVTFVKNGAFMGNTSIEKVIFPENVTALDGDVFNGCTSLTYVAMPGITELSTKTLEKNIYAQAVSTGNNFLNCVKLKTVIVNKNFSLYDAQGEAWQQFYDWRHDDAKNRLTPESCVNLYCLGTEKESKLNAAPNAKNILLTGVVYYKGDLSGCNQWQQDTDGSIEVSDHKYGENDVCENCKKINTHGVFYGYNDNSFYYVWSYTGNAETMKIPATYNDGTHGEHPVKYVKSRAFQDNATLKKVFLPESVDSLEGWAFANCANLEYVSIPGVKNLDYASLYVNGGSRDHNFRNCAKLKIVVVGEGFTTNCGQFTAEIKKDEKGNEIKVTPVVDLYVKGTSGGLLSKDTHNLFTGNTYYYSETEKENCWHYVKEDGEEIATLWGENK